MYIYDIMNIHSIVTIACGACSSANLTKPERLKNLKGNVTKSGLTWYNAPRDEMMILELWI
jgi:hypothetical protein